MIKYAPQIENECKIRGVSYEVIPDAKVTSILSEIADPSVNMDIVKLEKAPKIAVYTPPNKQPSGPEPFPQDRRASGTYM